MAASTRASMATTDAPALRLRPRPIVVAAAALAVFLVVLTLLTAQLRAGLDPALGPSTPALSHGQGTARIVTRTSGGPATATTHARNHAAGGHPITTRASGGGDGGEDD